MFDKYIQEEENDKNDKNDEDILDKVFENKEFTN